MSASAAEATRSESSPPILEIREVTKRFGSVQSLSGANLTIGKAEVVALVGDNGAGKSTLVKAIAGVHRPTSGQIFLDGQPMEFHKPEDSVAAGISTVYQDLALSLNLSVAANMFLGREVRRRGILGRFGFLDEKFMGKGATESLAKLHISVPADALCDGLSGGQRQAIAVARGAAWADRVLVLDEPTAALGVAQQREVDELIRAVRANGQSVILVSHNLRQVREVCDRIVVLLHGKTVAELPGDTDSNEVISWITGAALSPEAVARVDEESTP